MSCAPSSAPLRAKQHPSQHLCYPPFCFPAISMYPPTHAPAIGSGNPSNRVEFKLSHPRSRQVKRTELCPLYHSSPPYLASKTSSHTIPIPACRRECTNDGGVYRNRFMFLPKSWLQLDQMRLQMLYGATNRRR